MRKILKIDKIVVDVTIQPRAKGLDEQHVADLAQAYRDKKPIPPPHAWKIGDYYKLSQGFHRVQAAFEAGVMALEFEVREGTEIDCAIDALTGNQEHGLKRTNEDKRRAVDRLLELCPTWSDGRISKEAGVTQPFVSERRSQLITVMSSEPEKRLGLDGKLRTVPAKKAKESQEKPIVHAPGECRLRDVVGFPPTLADVLAAFKVVTLNDLAKWEKELPRGSDANPANLLRAVDRGHKLNLTAEQIHKGHDAMIDHLHAGKVAAKTTPTPTPAEPEPEADEPIEVDAADTPAVVEATTPPKAADPVEDTLVQSMEKVARAIDQLTLKVEQWKDDSLSYCVPFQAILASLRSARSDIWGTRPVYTCPYCKGAKKFKGHECKGCKGHGMVVKHVHTSGKGAMS